jgi:hypothetical protein
MGACNEHGSEMFLAKEYLYLQLHLLNLIMTFEELIKNHSADVIEKLITEVLSKDPVEIHFDFLKDDQWAIITTHQYEEDKEISLRLHLNDYYDLYFGYYNDEDEFFEIVHPLTEEEKKILPVRLKKVMKKVLDNEQGMRIANSFLSR